MFTSTQEELTNPARVVLEPANPTPRQYEALRAYFVEKRPSAEVARRFGSTPGSFRVRCHQFRRNPQRPFFLPPQKGPRVAPKRDRVREDVIALRKQTLSVDDISEALKQAGHPLSPVFVSTILKEEGVARLPRRRDDERPPPARPPAAAVADVRRLDLHPRQCRTPFGGLFLFLPYLAALPVDQLLRDAGFPGATRSPAGHAMRSLLALKLFGSARHRHVLSEVFDEGLAWFAGLHVIPTRAFLTEDSCRIDPACSPPLRRLWCEAVGQLGLARGTSCELDFHTIPFDGDDALMQQHDVSKRSRRQQGILAFLARDADTHVFCSAHGQLRQDEPADEILRFVASWQQRTGHVPQELIVASRLTTSANLNRLNTLGSPFITRRRRSRQRRTPIHHTPVSAWRRVELKNVTRA